MNKKIVLITLSIMALCLLVGCGNNKTKGIDKTDSSNYIGKWQTGEDFFILIEKGGTASYRPVDEPDRYYSMTWQIVDDVIALDYQGVVSNTRITLELNDEGTELVQVGGDFPARKQDRATFKKVD